MWSDEESPGNYMLFAGDAENGLGNIDTSNDCATDHPVPVPVPVPVVPATADVTFSVDMTGVDLQGQVPTLNSTFNGWCGDCNPMSDADGDDVWTVTVNIEHSEHGDHEYKYAIGAWVSGEAVPYNCSNTIGTNRKVTVDGDLTLPTDVYSGCPVGDTTGNTGGNTDSATYCASEVTHFNIDNHPGSILLSVENSGADSVTVTATSPDNVIDVLLVQSLEGGGIASDTTIVDGVATAEITWAAGTMPATTSFSLIWSDEASAGNQMVDAGDADNAIGYISTANICFVDIEFTEAFEGANISEGSVYTFPSYAKQWAGFTTVDSLNTIKFNEPGSISFSAYVPSGEIVDVRFRFEKNPWPDTEPSFETEHVTVSGTEIAEYTVNVPAQGALEFSSLIMYLNTRDEPVSISNVVVHASSLQSSVNELEPVVWQVGFGKDGIIIKAQWLKIMAMALGLLPLL